VELFIYRVMVRGRFSDLDDATREALVARVAEHDVISGGGFTEEGSLAYTAAIDFFTFRYQLRQRAETRAEADDAVAEEARRRADSALAALGASARDIKVQVTDMADVWR
jgi:hypothetical protein